MNCYQHSHNHAVGLCKSCFKALCPECAADAGNGLACKGTCEVKVQEINEMWERSAKIYGIGKHKSRMPSAGVLIWALLSIAYWVLVAINYFISKQIDYGSLSTAVIFTAILGVVYYNSRRTGLKC
jgi:hypothetical protein